MIAGIETLFSLEVPMGAIAFAEFKRKAGNIIEQVCDTAEIEVEIAHRAA